MEKKIEALFIDQLGWRYSKDGDITAFFVNGEMASVTWYRQGNEEFNGKYVISVQYVP